MRNLTDRQKLSTNSLLLGSVVAHLRGVLVHGVGAGDAPHHHADHRGGAWQGQVPQILARPRQANNKLINESVCN